MAATASRTSVKAVTSRTGRVACSLRASRNVSSPERPGIRTSEIIMANFPVRNVSRSLLAGLRRDGFKSLAAEKRIQQAALAGSSSTMRMRGES
jgi:hypothetical protein